MTIDERLERLIERHEALAPTVELLTRDVGELRSQVRELAATVQALTILAQQTFKGVNDLRESVYELARAWDRRYQAYEPQ